MTSLSYAQRTLMDLVMTIDSTELSVLFLGL
jgi:hypothetical protein